VFNGVFNTWDVFPSRLSSAEQSERTVQDSNAAGADHAPYLFRWTQGVESLGMLPSPEGTTVNSRGLSAAERSPR
jgi:hypothetical protein